MTPKRIVAAALLAFVAVSIAVLIARDMRGRLQPATRPADQAATAPAGRRVIVYYFHRNVRCETCNKIEAWTGQAVRQSFADALGEGLLEWKVLNFQASGNERYRKRFNLHTPSVIVADTLDGKTTRWQDLPDVWTLLDDRADFDSYIRDGVNRYLQE